MKVDTEVRMDDMKNSISVIFFLLKMIDIKFVETMLSIYCA